jgi:hypothetical protein
MLGVIVALVLGVVASVGFAAYTIAKDEKEEKKLN